MNNKEAIKYLIAPTATSTQPGTEYLKQKEAYDLAIKALERPQGEWEVKIISTFPQYQLNEYKCPFCKHVEDHRSNYCSECGADMRGNAE